MPINKEIELKASAIFFASIIGIALWTLFAAFGIAVSMSITLDSNISHPLIFALGFIFILVLTTTFSIAGFIASKVSHQKVRFDSMIHSIATWASMTIILVLLLFSTTAFHKVESAFDRIKPPTLVTDVEVFKAKATTTIEKVEPNKLSRAEKKEDKVWGQIWWIYSISMLLGLGASIGGGFLGRKG